MPLDAATKHVVDFAQTLQFNGQRIAAVEIGKAYFKPFCEFYRESKNIIKAIDDPAYCPTSCVVKSNFQPLESIEKSQAYLAHKQTVAALIQNTKLELGALHLKGLVLNNNERKKQLLEIFAKALPRLAESILVDADAKAYGKHNLVADYLIQHHNDLLATKQSGLQYFLGIYRTVNNCGRPPLDATELSDYRISLLVAGKTLDKIELPDDSPTKLSTANSSITPGTASTTAVSRSLNSTFEAVEKTPAEVAPAKSPSPIKIGNFILKVAEATAPARGICGTSFQTAKDFRDAIVPLVNSLKPKEKEPIEPVMPPYKDAPMCFNRTEDEEDLRELDITFNKLNRVESRKKEIKAESLLFVLTDSIRERPLLKSIPTKLPTPPTSA
jgi:hypothetical protein